MREERLLNHKTSQESTDPGIANTLQPHRFQGFLFLPMKLSYPPLHCCRRHSEQALGVGILGVYATLLLCHQSLLTFLSISKLVC